MLKPYNVETLKAHQANIAKHEAALAAAILGRDEFVRGMLSNGDSPTEIGAVLGVTRARIYQIRDRRR